MHRLPQCYPIPTYGFDYAYVNLVLYERQNVEQIKSNHVEVAVTGNTVVRVIFVQFDKINLTLF
jgi:hypothetical protein